MKNVILILLLIQTNYSLSQDNFIFKGDFENTKETVMMLYYRISPNKDEWELRSRAKWAGSFNYILEQNSNYKFVLSSSGITKTVYLSTKEPVNYYYLVDFNNPETIHIKPLSDNATYIFERVIDKLIIKNRQLVKQ